MWYNRSRKTTAHKVGCRFYSEEKIHPATGKFWGGFLMSGLFVELKYKGRLYNEVAHLRK